MVESGLSLFEVKVNTLVANRVGEAASEVEEVIQTPLEDIAGALGAAIVSKIAARVPRAQPMVC